jgi:predicted transcriptional regulator
MESTFNVRIDAKLRERFNRAAKAIHRPASQVIRELMRNFVAQSEEKIESSDNELFKRQIAADFSTANIELEGGKIPPDFAALIERYKRGEIGFTELHRANEADFGHLKTR